MINNTRAELVEDLTPKGRGRPKGPTGDKKKITQPIVNVMSAEQYAGMIAPMLNFSGQYMAAAADYEGFLFSPDEVKTLSEQGGAVAVELAPHLATKEGKLIAFGMTACFIVGLKYLGYRQHLKEMERQRNAPKEN